MVGTPCWLALLEMMFHSGIIILSYRQMLHLGAADRPVGYLALLARCIMRQSV